MSLLQNWRDIAYNQEADKKQLQQFWTNYFLIEKNIYEQLLSNPDEVVKGTPTPVSYGFIDSNNVIWRWQRNTKWTL